MENARRKFGDSIAVQDPIENVHRINMGGGTSERASERFLKVCSDGKGR